MAARRLCRLGAALSEREGTATVISIPFQIPLCVAAYRKLLEDGFCSHEWLFLKGQHRVGSLWLVGRSAIMLMFLDLQQ